jgi:DNA-binding NarL/FixJ family response regulator
MLLEPASAPEPVRVAVVSPSPAVRSGLRALIDGHDGIVVEAEWFELGDGAIFGPLDVIVGEANAGSVSGWREIAETRAVVLLGERETLLRYRGLLAGPVGLLLRQAGGEEIAAAVVATVRGLSVADPSLVENMSLMGVAVSDGPPGLSPLSAREVEVLRHVATGLPNKGIALELGISEHTVKFHISSIMSKLDASSRTEAVTLAVRRGLLPL